MNALLKPLRDLPDLEGFEFIGIDAEGREFPCRMRQMVTTKQFYIAGVTAFIELVGWRHRT